MKVVIRQEGETWLAVFDDVTCYSPVDGHNTACRDYIVQCTTPYNGDFVPILDELRRVGYDDLQVVKRL